MASADSQTARMARISAFLQAKPDSLDDVESVLCSKDGWKEAEAEAKAGEGSSSQFVTKLRNEVAAGAAAQSEVRDDAISASSKAGIAAANLTAIKDASRALDLSYLQGATRSPAPPMAPPKVAQDKVVLQAIKEASNALDVKYLQTALVAPKAS
mmetsp:Transcript_38341/g.69773  ORF Transcript_38341/g.69773 Transcript_38341/m.69773 type:complete len:155 (+) Transcript_38341:93-557(+)